MSISRSLLSIVALFGALAGCAARSPVAQDQTKVEEKQTSADHGVGHALLLYIPNRVFDLFDIVRLRLRLGPGLAVGARVTELVDFNLGAYTSVWAGIHGPRGRPAIPWPVGTEALGGLELSFIDTTDEDVGNGPHYGPAEIGLGVQALIIGADVGIEPWDAVDFLVGLLFLDPNNDDY